MPRSAAVGGSDDNSWLDRVLSLFTDVRAGEGVTAILMLTNIFLLLICYSIIKIVREPMILLGGGAEVRSYAAGRQAVMLVVYLAAARIGVAGFALTNLVLTLTWIGVALLIVYRHRTLCRVIRKPIAAGIAVGLLLIAAAAPAYAQETREEERAAAQADKAAHLHPWTPSTTERRLERIQKFLTNEPTFYPFIGSVFRGGWLAVGPGYRKRYAQSGLFDVHGAWSLKNYKAAEAALKVPDIADGLLGIDLRAGWLDAPKVSFYGVGNGSSAAAKSSFRYETTTIGISARVRPASRFAFGGGIDALDVDTGPGTSGTSIEQRFTATDVAGLGGAPTYARTRLFVEVDTRKSPGYTRSGGLYRVDAADYRQTNDGPYDFRRLDAEVNQFIPLLRENWVVALRAAASTTSTAAGNVVPYFLMPDLGGGSELRGYPSWRFRDRNRVLLTGEYRWMAGQFVDMALFVEAGKVVPRWDDINLDDLRRSYGIGVRFHTPLATVLRIEIARTRDEGTGLVFAFSPVF